MESAMRLRLAYALLATMVVAVGFPGRGLHAAGEPYAKVGEIPIGGAGAFDYLAVDSPAKRLYVTHGTEIVVIDLTVNKVVGRISDTPRVHGIAIGPGDRGFTSNGGEDKVGIVDLKTLQTVSKVVTGKNPDAILYEPKQQEIYALNHTGESATVFNAATGTVVATVPLGGTAETGQADPGLGRVFVNIEDKNSIDVIDVATHKVIASWRVAPAISPTGMAIDTVGHRLFIGGGKFMVMMDAASGKVVASAPICAGTDATFFDPGNKLAFSSCSDGNITVVHQDAPDKLTVVQTLATARGARTMALDPATHRLYTAAQKYQAADPAAAPAAGRGRGPAPIPDSFHVLIFAMN
jgi:DNA-binding beta-propeller fold protein YncE